MTRWRRKAPHYFTLVELLVVCAILAILFSLILPAFKKALYQARLITCASTQHQWGIVLTNYANDFDGWYPQREVNQFSGNPQAMNLSCDPYDDRPKIMPYFGGVTNEIGYCALNPVPFDIMSIQGYAVVCAGYEMWYGGFINRGDAKSGLLREGKPSQWTFNDKSYEFDVLLTDTDYNLPSRPYQLSSHPDSSDVLTQGRTAIAPWFIWAGYSSWEAKGAVRGTIDRNFLHGDLSVKTMLEIENNFGSTIYDYRLIPLPCHPASSDYSWGYLPPSR